MTWIAASAVAVRVAPRVKAGIKTKRSGEVAIRISLSELFAKELGIKKTSRATVSYDADDSAHFQVKIDVGGTIEITEYPRGGYWLAVESWDPSENLGAARKAETCKLLEKTANSFIAELPLAWFNGEKTVARERKTVAKNTPAATPPEKGSAQLDVVEYLGKRGVKVHRLAGGRFQINGEGKTLAEAVAIVNEHRKKAGLGALTLADVA